MVPHHPVLKRRFGTPFSDRMHLVERFRLIDAAALKRKTPRGPGPAVIYCVGRTSLRRERACLLRQRHRRAAVNEIRLLNRDKAKTI
jgi:hypothetical protein